MPEGRFGRQDAGDERQGAGTSGAPAGTSGELIRAYRVIVPLILLAMVVNSFSTLYDIHRGGRDIPLWEPWLWEGSSAVAILLAALVVHAASQIAPYSKAGWGRLLLVNALATLPFSAIHSGGMFGDRKSTRLNSSHVD